MPEIFEAVLTGGSMKYMKAMLLGAALCVASTLLARRSLKRTMKKAASATSETTASWLAKDGHK